MTSLSLAARIALGASGLFLLAGLLTGVWKYRGILASADHRAHPYVDIAHRAALLYSFACLVMMALVERSPYAEPVQVAAVAVPVFFFAAALASYVWHGWRRDTDNQLARAGPWTKAAMIVLIAGELGGIAVLVLGFFVRDVLGTGR